jgi:nucleotide-binding universal stress UspA family protein
MEPWAIVLLVAAIVVGASIGVLYVIPSTRPFIKTWWPAFLVVLLSLIGIAMYLSKVRKPHMRKPDKLDKTIENAKESITDAKLEAAVKRAESAAIHDHVLEELDEANKVQDVFARHAAKRQLLERARRTP